MFFFSYRRELTHQNSTCPICGKTGLRKLKQHILGHTQVSDKICPFCGKGFKHGFHLNSHIKSVHEVKREHTCPICNAAFVRLDNLRQHLYRVHKDVDSRVIKKFEYLSFFSFRFCDIAGSKISSLYPVISAEKLLIQKVTLITI